jgi:hypothetical protein
LGGTGAGTGTGVGAAEAWGPSFTEVFWPAATVTVTVSTVPSGARPFSVVVPASTSSGSASGVVPRRTSPLGPATRISVPFGAVTSTRPPFARASARPFSASARCAGVA